jgi:hypothetical protein
MAHDFSLYFYDKDMLEIFGQRLREQVIHKIPFNGSRREARNVNKDK